MIFAFFGYMDEWRRERFLGTLEAASIEAAREKSPALERLWGFTVTDVRPYYASSHPTITMTGVKSTNSPGENA